MLRVTYRYLSGRPLDGRDNHPYLTTGDGHWPGWKRQVTRLMVPVATVATIADPQAAETGGAVLAAGVLYAARRNWKRRRFDNEYVTPTLAAVSSPLGLVKVQLFVDPTLGNLTLRLAKALSPAEAAVRRLYGQHVEPMVRFGPERFWRSTRRVGEWIDPAVKPFRRPIDKPGARVELLVEAPFVTAEQRILINAIIAAKIPVADMQPTWHQVGPHVTATWVVRQRPPARVGYDELMTSLPGLAEWEFYIGAGPGNVPVTVSLHEDSPHMAVSAGSGAGKSVLAQTIAVQVLARGGLVTILDRKGSHRWALGLPGVDYCTRAEQMHNALVAKASLADERNTLALHEAEDWDPGPRHLVICEELNATIGQLTNYWLSVRDKSDPKKSPAVNALAELLFMGRSAKVNVLAIAQMLTARAIGGPEARENFGIRCLARYTANNWKMLVPEAAMPRASRTLGRWQVVVGGQATEVQVCFLTAAQARRLASPVPDRAKVPEGGLSSNVPGDRGQDPLLTLREACDMGVLPWTYDAAKKRLQRHIGAVPKPRAKRGTADLFHQDDLVAWVESERVS